MLVANHQKSDFVFKASGNQDGGEIEKEDEGKKQMSKEEEILKLNTMQIH
ncbi:unnamed protein product [Meloidogyne enterolobii]|uniref:Uncharacterized protein n=1 Tax=Meloidogyne enterolobii TaxID=390850 RepID=A0ACB1B7G7_MELEN